MLNEGDEVILPAPYWVSYYEIIKLSGGVPVEVPTSIDTDFKITAEQLEKVITPKTKMIWYSSPCNPRQVTSGTNSIAQRATIAAVEADPKVLNYMVEAFHKRRDLVVGLIKEIPGLKINVPEGAFYVFPDVSSFFGKTLNGTKIENATDFSMYLLAEAN
ncbi:unnamed protein product, partial [Cyprideis torosa]